MSAIQKALLAAAAAVFLSCAGGGTTNGALALLEFEGQGKADLARNTTLTFRFSAPIRVDQDLFQRLSIERVPEAGKGFDRALGDYVVVGEVVTFQPRYPELPDRSDSGLHGLSEYSVFCQAGADSLESISGKQLDQAIELGFATGAHFDDPVPTEPPRAIRLSAIDTVTGATTNLSRLDDEPAVLASLDSATLLANGRVVEPGAGGPPEYSTFWQFDLEVSEPLDPATITTKNVEMWEIREDALATADSAPAGYMGDAVSYRVPIRVNLIQQLDPATQTGVRVLIRVTPLQTLTDDARYRLVYRGTILGIDYRQQFIGTNGLTGDAGDAGGLGYVTEFLVYDRPAILSTRTLHYAPLEDGIYPESGLTTTDPSLVNHVPYDPPESPSNVVGVAPIFGDGSDGPLAVGSGAEVILDTGDTPNNQNGNPFDVDDLDPYDTYDNTGWPPAGKRTFDGIEPTEFQFASISIASSGTLRIRGVNPARLRCRGIVQVSGRIDAAGQDGENGSSGSTIRLGGAGGPGAFAGGHAAAGLRACNLSAPACTSFQNYLNACAQAKAAFPFSVKGGGPGRGNQGGEVYQYYYKTNALLAGTDHVSGTGGGGGGHAAQGDTGDDNLNGNGTPGTAGPACDSTYGHQNSSVIGVRGVGGSMYGDRTMGTRILGGSGGGAGGSLHQPTYASASGSGGAGGGGGGWLEIIARGAIYVNSGTIDVSGGRGGGGAVVTTYSSNNYRQATGAGGGGSGGALALISGDNINIAAGTLDARGGAGGPPANPGTSCPACNGGGAGAAGYLFLMDPDGFIDGLAVSGPGDYDSYGYGTLTVRPFQTARFGAITATTELFRVQAADPAYLDFDDSDFAGMVDEGQTITVYASSARPDAKDPLQPDLSTESGLVHVATIHNDAGSVVVDLVPNAMALLNPGGAPNRESFLRIHVQFEYTDDVQAATGPFATLDRVTVRLRFNG